MHELTAKEKLLNVFETGHQRVLKSLIQFTNKSFDIETIKVKSFEKNDLLSELKGIPFHENLTLFKTEIIGDIFGKSYWLIDDLAQQYITNTDNNHDNNKINLDFSYEMLREVDNIISATLISQLSEHFSLEIYGDVPEVVLPRLKPLPKIVGADFQNARMHLFTYGVEFKITEAPSAICTFLWCLEENLLLKE